MPEIKDPRKELLNAAAKEEIINEIGTLLCRIDSLPRLKQARSIISLLYNQYLIDGRK